MICPAGGHKIAHPDGERATAQGGMSNALMMLSTSSHYSMEEVAQTASGPLWFQPTTVAMRSRKCWCGAPRMPGYKAVVLTVDTPLPAPKERDIRNRYENPFPPANFHITPDAMAALSGTDEAPNWQPPHGASARLERTGLATLADLSAPGVEGCAHGGRRARSGGMRCQWHPGVDAWWATNGRHAQCHRELAGDCGGL